MKYKWILIVFILTWCDVLCFAIIFISILLLIHYLIVRKRPFDLAPSSRSRSLGRIGLSFFLFPFRPITIFSFRFPLLAILLSVFLEIVFGVVIVLVDLKFVIVFGRKISALPSLSFWTKRKWGILWSQSNIFRKKPLNSQNIPVSNLITHEGYPNRPLLL